MAGYPPDIRGIARKENLSSFIRIARCVFLFATKKKIEGKTKKKRLLNVREELFFGHSSLFRRKNRFYQVRFISKIVIRCDSYYYDHYTICVILETNCYRLFEVSQNYLIDQFFVILSQLHRLLVNYGTLRHHDYNISQLSPLTCRNDGQCELTRDPSSGLFVKNTR